MSRLLEQTEHSPVGPSGAGKVRTSKRDTRIITPAARAKPPGSMLTCLSVLMKRTTHAPNGAHSPAMVTSRKAVPAGDMPAGSPAVFSAAMSSGAACRCRSVRPGACCTTSQCCGRDAAATDSTVGAGGRQEEEGVVAVHP